MEQDLVDVVGVGNAIVDVISLASDDFVEGQGLQKGSMTLIDRGRAGELYALMGPGIEASGGSAANTAAGVTSFGGTASYIGKVRNDTLGEVFAHDMRASGVSYEMEPAETGPDTARCLILVTPDAQRTMNTYLGISSLLEPADVVASTVERGRILFCEGYLWDVDSAKQAIRRAMDIATAAGRRVAFTASDSFCVERHHQEFLELVAGPIDIMFANIAELTRLYESDFDSAVDKIRHDVELGCLTMGKHGSLLVTADETTEIAPEQLGPVVDTTGAGDQYAAGVLYGLAHKMELADAGRLGSLAAAEVISHVGPRPLRSLAEFL